MFSVEFFISSMLLSQLLAESQLDLAGGKVIYFPTQFCSNLKGSIREGYPIAILVYIFLEVKV